MKYRSTLIIIALILSTTAGFSRNRTKEAASPNETPAQITSKVSGIVLDKTTGEALVGVKVKIEGCDQEEYTNFDGNFEFTNLKPGAYSIICNMVTYEDFRMNEVKIGADDPVKTITFRLSPVSVMPRSNRKSPAINLG